MHILLRIFEHGRPFQLFLLFNIFTGEIWKGRFYAVNVRTAHGKGEGRVVGLRDK